MDQEVVTGAQPKKKFSERATITAKKRIRNDTFGSYSDEENGKFFQSVKDETNSTYRLQVEAVKKDFKGRERECWRAYSVKTGKPVDSIRSAKPYRLALAWAATVGTYLHEKNKIKLKANLPRIAGKRGDHSRHRCGNDWCCNPGHIVVGSRADNEVDKHYHYFLNHRNPDVRAKFIEAFPDLMEKQSVW